MRGEGVTGEGSEAMDECAEFIGMLGVEPSKQLSRDGGLPEDRTEG